ncbi:hypothetical protein CRD59_07625 [Bifidobacterium xylocopae]|uniref:Uncharacterized protein n=2 Tax=Bifidobacterium xylocopae TaxID=2493119 RepID=A0A366KAE6_9BIFI|nr:hypothetical protein CRD59_07625 [Bifidobacterium xylocopae]
MQHTNIFMRSVMQCVINYVVLMYLFFFSRQQTATDLRLGLVGSDMCIRGRLRIAHIDAKPVAHVTAESNIVEELVGDTAPRVDGWVPSTRGAVSPTSSSTASYTQQTPPPKA